MSLLPYALGAAVIGGLAILIHKLFNKNNKMYCHTLLYEKVGEQEVFMGIKEVFKVETNAVTCLKIRGEEHSFIDFPEYNDFFPVKSSNIKMSKVLHIVKYGERDYRVKKKFDETWHKEITLPVYEEFVEEIDGVEHINKRIKTINGKPVHEVIKVDYTEPMGITQKGMDAIRAGLQNEREINKELESTGFWNKYGTSMVFIFGLMIIALMVIKSTQNVSDAANGLVTTCDEAAKLTVEAAKKIDEPHWAENVLTYVQERNSVPEPPPN